MSEVRAKKALGQHFLVDLNIARKICDALSGGERPGAGAETRANAAGYAGAGAEARTMAAGSADAGAETRNGDGAGMAADARLAADTTAAGAPAAAEEERGGAVPLSLIHI